MTRFNCLITTSFVCMHIFIVALPFSLRYPKHWAAENRFGLSLMCSGRSGAYEMTGSVNINYKITASSDPVDSIPQMDSNKRSFRQIVFDKMLRLLLDVVRPNEILLQVTIFFLHGKTSRCSSKSNDRPFIGWIFFVPFFSHSAMVNIIIQWSKELRIHKFDIECVPERSKRIAFNK